MADSTDCVRAALLVAVMEIAKAVWKAVQTVVLMVASWAVETAGLMAERLVAEWADKLA